TTIAAIACGSVDSSPQAARTEDASADAGGAAGESGVEAGIGGSAGEGDGDGAIESDGSVGQAGSAGAAGASVTIEGGADADPAAGTDAQATAPDTGGPSAACDKNKPFGMAELVPKINDPTQSTEGFWLSPDGLTLYFDAVRSTGTGFFDAYN